MKTLQYLKNYAYYYIYVVGFVLLCAFGMNRAVSQVSSMQSIPVRPVIVIDPGHGGMDGGTTSCTGVQESQLNLEIAQRMDAVFRLLGYETAMTRQEDVSLDTQGSTVREQKRSDLQNRAELANSYNNCVLLSVHQNHFTQSQYSGPQIFYAAGEESRAMASQLQEVMNRILAPSSNRTIKQADGVYLMEHINCPGVLVECGFLSNAQEEALLRNEQYQKKLSAVVCAAVAAYIETTAVS